MHKPDPRWVEQIQKCSLTAGAFAILAGGLVLTGWVFDIQIFKNVFPGYVDMKANLALGFILAGMSLWIHSRDSPYSSPRRFRQACALAAAVIGGFTLFEYILDWDAGIDQILFREAPGAVGTLSPGRMAPTAALNLLIVGMALLLMESRGSVWMAQLLAIFSGLIALQASVNYVLGERDFSGVGAYTQMAMHAGLTFSILSAGLLCARPRHGVMTVVTSGCVGGVMARSLLPAVFLLPLVMGWMELEGRRLGLYSADFGDTVYLMSIVLILFVIVWRNGLHLCRLDEKRSMAEESSRQLADIVDFSDDAVLRVGLDGVIQTWNKGAEKTYGYTAEEAVGKTVSLIIPSDRPNELRNILDRIHRGEKIEHFETVRIRKDGRAIHTSLKVSQIKDAAGRVVGLSGISRDITERKRIEQMRNNFISMVNHELNSPITVISGAVSLLKEAGDAETGAEPLKNMEIIQMIDRNARRLSRLAADVTDITQLGTETFRLNKERISVWQPIRSVYADLAPQAPGKKLEIIDLSGDDAPPFVMADAPRLEQVVGNLLRNALRYAKSSVQVRVEVASARAAILVDDDGPGIDPVDIPHLFEAFFRGRRQVTAKKDGSGLGLAIVKGIVEAHGGKVWVERNSSGRADSGVRFVVTLPVTA
ncbi:PAS domain S-box protein [bacterium]|nr:PAS domain S-box protein [bacterium]